MQTRVEAEPEAARREVKIESREADTECPFAQYTLKEEEETPKNKKSNSGATERAPGSGGQANEESSLRLKVVGPGEKTVYVDVPFEGSPGIWRSVARAYAAQAVSAKISAPPPPEAGEAMFEAMFAGGGHVR